MLTVTKTWPLGELMHTSYGQNPPFALDDAMCVTHQIYGVEYLLE